MSYVLQRFSLQVGGGDADNAKSVSDGKPGGGKAPSPFEGSEVQTDGPEQDPQSNGIMQNGLDPMPDRCVVPNCCLTLDFWSQLTVSRRRYFLQLFVAGTLSLLLWFPQDNDSRTKCASHWLPSQLRSNCRNVLQDELPSMKLIIFTPSNTL